MLEHTTVFAMQGGLLLLLGAVILFAFRGERRKRGDGSGPWLAAAYFAGGLGLGVLAMERDLPLPVLTPVGNALFLLFSPLAAQGLAKSLGVRTQIAAYLAVLDAVAIAAFYYFTYVNPGDVARSVVSLLVSGVMYGAVIAVLMRSKDALIERPRRTVVWLFAFQIFTSVARVVIWRFTHTVTWLPGLNIITSAGVALSYLWMNHLVVQARLEQTAMTDPLTGLYNRRGLEVFGMREMHAARRRGEACSALMVDLDGFKQVNDRLGHAAGDASLSALAAVLRDTIGTTDVAVRIGGDEFFVLLPGVDESGTVMLVGRLQERVAGIRLVADGVPYGVEATVGAVTERGDAITLEALLQGSDAALYREKQALRVERDFASNAMTLPFDDDSALGAMVQ